MTTGRPIDRETVSQYALTVLAAAGTDTANISLSLTVDVLDVNDHAPRFDQLSYAITLTGNESPGTHLVQVRAVDDDLRSSLNSFITYRLDLPADSVRAGALFAVDALTGWLTVARRLREIDGQLLLRVVAQDHGAERVHSSSTSVYVNILSRRPSIISPPHNATILVQQVRCHTAQHVYIYIIIINTFNLAYIMKSLLGLHSYTRCGK